MSSCAIERLSSRDARYDLPDGAGSDSVHSNPQYAADMHEIRELPLIE